MQLSEQEIIRRQSKEELEKLGIDPYPADRFDVNVTIADIVANFSEDKKDDYKEIDVQLRKVKVLSQDQKRRPHRMDMKRGTIFPSKNIEELQQEAVKKNTML